MGSFSELLLISMCQPGNYRTECFCTVCQILRALVEGVFNSVTACFTGISPGICRTLGSFFSHVLCSVHSQKRFSSQDQACALFKHFSPSNLKPLFKRPCWCGMMSYVENSWSLIIFISVQVHCNCRLKACSCCSSGGILSFSVLHGKCWQCGCSHCLCNIVSCGFQCQATKKALFMLSPCFLSLLWVHSDLTVAVLCTFHHLNLCHSHRGTPYPGFWLVMLSNSVSLYLMMFVFCFLFL